MAAALRSAYRSVNTQTLLRQITPVSRAVNTAGIRSKDYATIEITTTREHNTA